MTVQPAFAGRTLAEFAARDPGLELVRDGRFSALGYLVHDQPELLTVLYDQRFLEALLAHPTASAVIASPELRDRIPGRFALAVAASPLEALLRIHIRLHEEGAYWRSFETRIDPGARIHPRAYVAPTDVVIGPGVVVEPNATILERSIIGEDCVIRAGAVIGAEGYEPRTLDGRRVIVPHAGGVRLGCRVQLQANSCVSRNLFGGFTEIGDETTTDNLVHIAHGVALGRRCRLAAAAMIAGSVTIGDDVWIGPNATVSSGIRIGSRARVSLGAVVTRSVPEDGHVSGNFAVDHHKLITFLKTVR